MLAVCSKSGRLCTLLSAEAWAVASVACTNTLTRTTARCPGSFIRVLEPLPRTAMVQSVYGVHSTVKCTQCTAVLCRDSCTLK